MKNLEVLKQKWESSLRDDDIDNLLFLACSGFIESAKNSNKEYQEKFIRFIKTSFLLAEKDNGASNSISATELQCSFCRKQYEDEALLHGVDVAICESCINFGQSALKK